MGESILETKWKLKGKLLAHVVTWGLPTDGDELKKMNDYVFGEDCTFENVNSQKNSKRNYEKRNVVVQDKQL